MRTLLFLIALLLVSPAFAQTGQVVQCGVPADVTLETDPGKDYCDIHTRAATYREKDRAYREQIEERRRNYAAPRAQALQAYQDRQVSGTVSSPPPEDDTSDSAGEATSDQETPINLLEGIQ